MLKFTLFAGLLFFSRITCGQSTVKELDKALSKSVKGKLKKLVIRKLGDGFATFYYRSNKDVFSVEQRERFGVNKKWNDSSFSFSANFRNDTLFRFVIRRAIPFDKRGMVIMYLDGDSIVAKEIHGNVYLPEMIKIKDSAYKLLAKAKMLIAAR